MKNKLKSICAHHCAITVAMETGTVLLIKACDDVISYLFS